MFLYVLRARSSQHILSYESVFFPRMCLVTCFIKKKQSFAYILKR
jgi:hypothetical protein